MRFRLFDLLSAAKLNKKLENAILICLFFQLSQIKKHLISNTSTNVAILKDFSAAKARRNVAFLIALVRRSLFTFAEAMLTNGCSQRPLQVRQAPSSH